MKNRSFKEVIEDPQMIIAICVVILSLCALVVSIYQAKIMGEQRELMLEQAKASVWPRLELGISKSHARDGKVIAYKMFVTNQGVGPAIIEGVKVSYDDRAQTNWWKLFKEFNLPDTVETFISNSDLSNSVIQQGDDIRVISLTTNKPLANIFFKHSKKIKFEIYYKSIYGDMWKLTQKLRSREKMTIEKVDKCPILEDEEFIN